MTDLSRAIDAAPQLSGPALVARALRAGFLPASLGPFLVGALLPGGPVRLGTLLAGLAVVGFAHLACNVHNDLADSRSGADWIRPGYFAFFGGSQLIQQGLLGEADYRRATILFAGLAWAAAGVLAGLMDSLWPMVYLAAVSAAGWSYSGRPLRLSYRGFGEAVIFLLFGPATVLAGATTQTGRFPHLDALWVSLPLGLATVAILLANELPDRRSDRQAGKINLAGLLGPDATAGLYLLVNAMVVVGLVGCVAAGFLGPIALAGSAVLIPAAWAALHMRRHRDAPARLRASSRVAIAIQAVVTLCCLAGARPWFA
jgi:1,4-dihydroxy-2-naphthoate octaprenyltransferase